MKKILNRLQLLIGTTTYRYRDFTPICILFHEYVTFEVKADSPIKNGRDLVERLAKNPRTTAQLAAA